MASKLTTSEKDGDFSRSDFIRQSKRDRELVDSMSSMVETNLVKIRSKLKDLDEAVKGFRTDGGGGESDYPYPPNWSEMREELESMIKNARKQLKDLSALNHTEPVTEKGDKIEMSKLAEDHQVCFFSFDFRFEYYF